MPPLLQFWLPIVLAIVLTALGMYEKRKCVIQTLLYVLAAVAVTAAITWHIATLQITNQVVSTPEHHILAAWGSAPPFCIAQVNGKQLMHFRDKYAVAIVCGTPVVEVDRFEDKKISTSQLFTIRAENIGITVHHNQEMTEQVKNQIEKILKLRGLSEVPSGSTVTVPQWYEVVVLPKATDVSEIRRLSDVARYGGKILSQEGYAFAQGISQ